MTGRTGNTEKRNLVTYVSWQELTYQPLHDLRVLDSDLYRSCQAGPYATRFCQAFPDRLANCYLIVDSPKLAL
jgi:hypothetical protein